MTAAGSGMSTNPTVAITGDGTGATALAVRQAPFYLAKGADCTLPAGAVMEFVVDENRIIREVGDYSVRL